MLHQAALTLHAEYAMEMDNWTPSFEGDE
jgi:hypothetical protein